MSDEMTLDELRERLSSVRTVMVSSLDPEGSISARPLTVQEIDDRGDIWFIVARDAHWVTPGEDLTVNVAFTDDDEGVWVSFSGRGAVVDDRARRDELWDPITDAYFPEGKEGDNAVVLHVRSDRAEWWTGTGTLQHVFELVKSKLGGDHPDLGDRGTVDL